eukprot:1140771-Pelagomonas_calceolata.AAC.9
MDMAQEANKCMQEVVYTLDGVGQTHIHIPFTPSLQQGNREKFGTHVWNWPALHMEHTCKCGACGAWHRRPANV